MKAVKGVMVGLLIVGMTIAVIAGYLGTAFVLLIAAMLVSRG